MVKKGDKDDPNSKVAKTAAGKAEGKGGAKARKMSLLMPEVKGLKGVSDGLRSSERKTMQTKEVNALHSSKEEGSLEIPDELEEHSVSTDGK